MVVIGTRRREGGGRGGSKNGGSLRRKLALDGEGGRPPFNASTCILHGGRKEGRGERKTDYAFYPRQLPNFVSISINKGQTSPSPAVIAAHPRGFA